MKYMYNRVDPGSKNNEVMRSCSGDQVDVVKCLARQYKKGDRSGPLTGRRGEHRYRRVKRGPFGSPNWSQKVSQVLCTVVYIWEPSPRSKDKKPRRVADKKGTVRVPFPGRGHKARNTCR